MRFVLVERQDTLPTILLCDVQGGPSEPATCGKSDRTSSTAITIGYADHCKSAVLLLDQQARAS